ncbi:MAG: hypothetical protein A3C30_03355 [Candidatus Levybacteria bacterium RIFCSPHIGHO2_02_FULL_40_18]|nr:MAG: hypothetical protein A2869_01885 [Candidatus Levybacteria bacterium RIFCSPHIGHO2_01_FULL_40_58]OGH26127.1 MAG: hypothetical protein A3C30_03355 [Candidatus Levybacteria bacterium RIFCSPHIGHO2_02_FULL_40_18]OGH31325.1 MAG: hypothetical protein A3E43_03150 [Candidatus Levybacteria bacterium RIFCSPHIGHO2_12_FULL_40_31]OGH39956.1 MAG: hypothetical protein A2894_02705 [Candidatus Levybacteria bacterium RIFCSPLOWO2_01_FULL_40_64]OGH49602.1 MAG: hypothetical protein A3I54_05140 [Candidatus Lev
MKQVYLLVSGFVQGVGYRAFVRREAEKLGLTGWVRNLSDNRVEVVVQSSDKKTLEKFVKICEKGPFLAEVRDTAIEWQEPSETFSEFEQKPSV